MVTLLLTSVLIIGFLAVALYFWAKPTSSSNQAALPPRMQPRGLFSEPDTTDPATPDSDQDEAENQRTQLVEKAEGGDKSALDQAQVLGDQDFYDQVLNLLVKNAETDAALLSLVSHVARHELPVNQNLAGTLLDSWKRSPDRNSTAKALHVAALADDAALYQTAVEAALQYWRSGALADISPAELLALFDGEFWVLSSRTRSSGAGFILKRTLANARRELGNTAGIKI